MTLLGIAVGGGLGTLARYHLEGVIAPRQPTPFPLSTLVVNVSGSVLLGLLVGLVLSGRVPAHALEWGGVGFLGAFTTFSTFTYETVRLIEEGAWRYAWWNLLLSGPLAFLGAALGFFLVR